MRAFERWEPIIQGYPDYIDVRALTTTAETFDIPTGARFVSITATGSCWITYVPTALVELITNGGFASDASWTVAGTWSIAGGVATRTAGAAGPNLTQSGLALVSGKSYGVTVTHTRSAGSFTMKLGGGTAGSAINTSATTTQVIVAGSDGTFLAIADATFAGTLDDIKVAPIAVAHTADVTGGVASELIYPNIAPVIRGLDGLSQLSMVAPAATTPSVSLAYYS